MNTIQEVRDEVNGYDRIAYVDPGLGGTGVVIFSEGTPVSAMCSKRATKKYDEAIFDIADDVLSFVSFKSSY